MIETQPESDRFPVEGAGAVGLVERLTAIGAAGGLEGLQGRGTPDFATGTHTLTYRFTH